MTADLPSRGSAAEPERTVEEQARDLLGRMFTRALLRRRGYIDPERPDLPIPDAALAEAQEDAEAVLDVLRGGIDG